MLLPRKSQKPSPTRQFVSALGTNTLSRPKRHHDRAREQNPILSAPLRAADVAISQRKQSAETRGEMEQYRRAMMEQIRLSMQTDAGSPNPRAPRLAPIDSPGSAGSMTPMDLSERTEYFITSTRPLSHRTIASSPGLAQGVRRAEPTRQASSPLDGDHPVREKVCTISRSLSGY